MLKVLFSSKPENWAIYRDALAEAFTEFDLDVDLATDHPAKEVDYIVFSPNGPVTDFSPFTKAKAVLSLWAGVENIIQDPTLTMPLARMVDTSMTEGMVEWVTGHVLRHHLGMDQHIQNPDRVWAPVAPPLARDRNVTVLGLGELGQACARMLAGLNFRVTGWSRSEKTVDGIRCCYGEDGLNEALKEAEILVLLLPLTSGTENTLNSNTFDLLPDGAVIINPGRGGLIDDNALLQALDTGRVGHATLDVFRKEPLSNDHPFWVHPHVTVTPHIASETRPRTAALTIAENIKRSETGLPLLHLVDRKLGY